MQTDDNFIFVSKSYKCLPFFFLQSLVCALMAANLWLNAQAQVLPVNFFNVPALPQNQQIFLNPVAGGTVPGVVPVIPGVAGVPTAVNGITQNFGVSIY